MKILNNTKKLKFKYPNFILTRKHTMMEGYDYCDFCYHNTRIKKDIIHPSEDYWKEFN